MEKVYMVAIVAAASILVILVVAFLFRKTLRKGKFEIGRDKIQGSIENVPHSEHNTQSGRSRTTRQEGETVVEDSLMAKSKIKAPRRGLLHVVKSKLWNSTIEIYDSPSEEDKTNDANRS